jgi:hypothetical protein
VADNAASSPQPAIPAAANKRAGNAGRAIDTTLTISRLAVTAVALTALSCAASAQIRDGEAFGIAMGATVMQLDVCCRSAAFEPSEASHRLNSVPRPHPLLRHYAANIGDRAGVCRIHASATFSPGEVTSAMATLLADLRRELGAPDSDRDDRIGRAILWTRAGATRRVELSLTRGAADTMLRVEVEFRNFEDCRREGLQLR